MERFACNQMKVMLSISAMDEICEQAKKAAGGPSKLAKALGITSQAVSQWRCVPAGYVMAVERLTGISKHKLRPDVFGLEPDKKGEAAA